ncbi:DNA mismatch endonuclease Vsr [Marivirga sp. S37H4]|uniref:Very short patch repair endonuclease n=1 Tax=Marivirga aurantiaca TaxID=2802615 RepID=A0A935C9Q5_9BACT|nr:DNA mismatch endonuclease Vsr [Marivirga aurantiaca]MBK6264388.1 DNA mismatch endonuclease Vsr [Marivirga aurantiaca]
MADVHEPAIRSYNMSQIKGKDTKPEILVRKFLHKHGFRFRLHSKNLSGKPDIVLPKYKTVIFVNGCFWHGHENCKYFKLPKTRTEWWEEKINGTVLRDQKNYGILEKEGWKIITIWECELKTNKNDMISNKLIGIIKKMQLQKGDFVRSSRL